MTDLSIQRALAEQAYAEELDQLARNDRRPRPSNWRLSSWAVASEEQPVPGADNMSFEPKLVQLLKLRNVLASFQRAAIPPRPPTPSNTMACTMNACGLMAGQLWW